MFFGSLVFKICCKIDETACDLPDPVAPTIAKCLLKNLFPFTGIGIVSS